VGKKEFLKLLNAHQVEYLLIGGYAVAYHGYPRATADMDISGDCTHLCCSPSASSRRLAGRRARLRSTADYVAAARHMNPLIRWAHFASFTLGPSYQNRV